MFVLNQRIMVLVLQIEGDLPSGAKVVVVEDLISTGGSSLSAVDCLQKEGADNVGHGCDLLLQF